MPPSEQAHSFQAPKGTRDFYPQDLLKKRYIEKMWRDTSIRHGFEEIDGPTFEHLDLYTVKSGEGIISELFSFRREGGEKDYALRPEFTPTLARMYASKAGSLPKPTKWFWQQNCYRAEKPQRGRLREFGQWNCDLIGGEAEAQAQARVDAEVLGCCINMLTNVGLEPRAAGNSQGIVIRINDRRLVASLFVACGVDEARMGAAFEVLDRRAKLPPPDFIREAATVGLQVDRFDELTKRLREAVYYAFGPSDRSRDALATLTELGIEPAPIYQMREMFACLSSDQYVWCEFDPSIARGLAYYTGMVFEVHEAGGKERAIAGGGRYDKLIEMFGGPPTPAVGFGMGDVVLSLVLQDRNLMPEGKALLDKLSEPGASLRPDIFVISNGQPESDAAVRPLIANLRRGTPTTKPLHARHTYKTTKNVGKLLQEAASSSARFAAIIENANEATLKNLDTGAQEKLPLSELAIRVAQR